jgi:hypothetical protein
MKKIIFFVLIMLLFSNILLGKANAGDNAFQYPMYKEYRLGWCLKRNSQCGKPAADAWCQWKGYEKAIRWQQAADIGLSYPTKLFSSGEICNRKFCDGFSKIECKQKPMMPRLIEAKACLRVGNTEMGPVTCEGEGGHNFGRTVKTFCSDDSITILLRFRNLPTGKHTLRTEYYVYNNEEDNYNGEDKYDETYSFSNNDESWDYWFQARARESGGWKVKVFLDEYKQLGEDKDIEYCVNHGVLLPREGLWNIPYYVYYRKYFKN